MRWQTISMKLALALLLGWVVSTSTWADVDTDKSIIAASAKMEEERELTAAELLARSQELNETYEASVLSGFQPGQAQTPQQALVALYSAFRVGDPEVAALYLDLRYLPEALEEVPPVNIARGLLFVFAQQNVLDLSRISSQPEGENDRHQILEWRGLQVGFGDHRQPEVGNDDPDQQNIKNESQRDP